jgi:hypothetical protein
MSTFHISSIEHLYQNSYSQNDMTCHIICLKLQNQHVAVAETNDSLHKSYLLPMGIVKIKRKEKYALLFIQQI